MSAALRGIECRLRLEPHRDAVDETEAEGGGKRIGVGDETGFRRVARRKDADDRPYAIAQLDVCAELETLELRLRTAADNRFAESRG